MVFAANRAAAAGLSRQFAEGSASRTYRAIVQGFPSTEAGELSNLLVFDRRRNLSRVVPGDSGHPDARPARLSYRLLARGERYSLVEVTLRTGRHHPIRAQLSAAGMPIRGDVKYGARRGLPGRVISLYATALTITHPVTGAPMEYVLEPSGDDLWQRLGDLIR